MHQEMKKIVFWCFYFMVTILACDLMIQYNNCFFRKAFTAGYDLLSSSHRTGCQSIIVFVTDGKDTDAESVRCGPGKYLVLYCH